MGAAFTIFLLVPIFLPIIIISMAFGFVTGNDRTEFVLPYEPEKGIVWECDFDESFYKLADTEIDRDEQIFYIRHKAFKLPDSEKGKFSSIIFTDENGNQKKYYVCLNTDTAASNDLRVYAPGEYYDFDYTVKAENPNISYSWSVRVADSEYVLYNSDTDTPEITFTVIHPYDTYESGSYTICFNYGEHTGNSKEGYSVTYSVTENGAEIIKESHQFYD